MVGMRTCSAGNDGLWFVCKNGSAKVCSHTYFALPLKQHAKYVLKIIYFEVKNIPVWIIYKL